MSMPKGRHSVLPVLCATLLLAVSRLTAAVPPTSEQAKEAIQYEQQGVIKPGSYTISCEQPSDPIPVWSDIYAARKQVAEVACGEALTIIDPRLATTYAPDGSPDKVDSLVLVRTKDGKDGYIFVDQLLPTFAQRHAVKCGESKIGKAPIWSNTAAKNREQVGTATCGEQLTVLDSKVDAATGVEFVQIRNEKGQVGFIDADWLKSSVAAPLAAPSPAVTPNASPQNGVRTASAKKKYAEPIHTGVIYRVTQTVPFFVGSRQETNIFTGEKTQVALYDAERTIYYRLEDGRELKQVIQLSSVSSYSVKPEGENQESSQAFQYVIEQDKHGRQVMCFVSKKGKVEHPCLYLP
jgi:hypothetical protein